MLFNIPKLNDYYYTAITEGLVVEVQKETVQKQQEKLLIETMETHGIDNYIFTRLDSERGYIIRSEALMKIARRLKIEEFFAPPPFGN